MHLTSAQVLRVKSRIYKPHYYTSWYCRRVATLTDEEVFVLVIVRHVFLLFDPEL